MTKTSTTICDGCKLPIEAVGDTVTLERYGVNADKRMPFNGWHFQSWCFSQVVDAILGVLCGPVEQEIVERVC